MNFISVTRQREQLAHELFTYDLSDETANRLPAEVDEVVLGIRPEDISLEAGDGRNTIERTVDVTEPMGDQTHLYLDLADQSLTATVNGFNDIDPGDKVRLALPEERIHLFDGKSGEALKNGEIVDEGDFSRDIQSAV
jgi:multiple sugar transport system ATP-binding protein